MIAKVSDCHNFSELSIQTRAFLTDLYALTESDRRRQECGEILPCVTGCAFFGTPFLGTQLAPFFSHVAALRRKNGDMKVSKSLWSIMGPESHMLSQLRHEFNQLSQRINPGIALSYFYEELPVSEEEKQQMVKIGLTGCQPSSIKVESDKLRDYLESCLKVSPSGTAAALIS